MSSQERIGVIGGGLGGLAAACTLAARGYKVVLFEKNDWLGGKAAVLKEDGFRFDMGPTILTLPVVLERIFREAGLDLHEELDLVRLDPQWRCFFDGRRVLDLHEDVERMTATLDSFTGTPAAGEGYRKLMAKSENLHEISDRFFFWKSVEGIRDTLDLSNTFNLSTLKRPGRPAHGAVRRRRHPRPRAGCPNGADARPLHAVRRLLALQQPRGALLASRTCRRSEGVWYPMGGTRAVPEALASWPRGSASRRAIQTGVERDRRREGPRARRDHRRRRAGAPLGGRLQHGRGAHVPRARGRRGRRGVSSVPLLRAGLLGRRALPRAAIERYDHLAHHNFVFSRDPEEEFDCDLPEGRAGSGPDLLRRRAVAHRARRRARPGGEALYVLVHTPYLRPHHDWSHDAPGLPPDRILDKLKRTAGLEDIEERIVVERALTPQDIHDRYHVLDGAIYGLASHGRFVGAFKPANRSRQVEGLYLAGGAAHPGPGMPMVMMSGWIAADTLDGDGLVRRTRDEAPYLTRASA